MNRKFSLQLFCLIALISLGIGASIYDKRKLENCKKEGTGIIYDIQKRKNRGHFVQYKYFVENIEYKSSETIRSKLDLQKFSIGDSLRIFISCENPKVSKYISINDQ